MKVLIEVQFWLDLEYLDTRAGSPLPYHATRFAAGVRVI